MGHVHHPKSPNNSDRIKKVKKTDYPKSGHSAAMYTLRGIFYSFLFAILALYLAIFGYFLNNKKPIMGRFCYIFGQDLATFHHW